MRFSKKSIRYLLIDPVCAIVSLLLATLLRHDLSVSDAIEYMKVSPAFFIVLPCFAVFWGIIFGSYRAIYLTPSSKDAFRQIDISVMTVVSVYIVHLFLKFPISRGISILFGILFFILSIAVRYAEHLMRTMIIARETAKNPSSRVLIVGAGHAASMLIHMLATRPDMKLSPVAAVDDDRSKYHLTVSGVKVCGTTDDIPAVVKAHKISEIIIAIPSAKSSQLKAIFDKCKGLGIPVRSFATISDFHDFMSGAQSSLKNISIEDLLFRDSIETDMSAVSEYIRGKSVLVTGGAGSIGSELCRQVMKYGCRHLVIMDINENGLFYLQNELLEKYPEERFCARVGSIRDKVRMDYLFKRHKFDIVFHAAAHKHVPMMEANIFEAVKNNVFGTKNVIECCIENQTERFVLISTDKAVNPTNVMGATKRMAELLVQYYNGRGCELAAVRFGNVLGSNGSVIPIFRKQIESGGPVTVTDRNIMRYFMTIPEAVSLVLDAGVSAEGGEVFVLDMGQPVNIYDLACNMIELAGLRVNEDIEIKITGLRPGEKMFEELLLEEESFTRTGNNKIFIMHDDTDIDTVESSVKRLEELINSDCGDATLKNALFESILVDIKESAARGKDLSAFSHIV